MILKFELRGYTREEMSTGLVDGQEKVFFEIRPIIGVSGNTYDGFTYERDIIDVICNKSDTGDQMESHILSACTNYLITNFPDLP